MKKKLIRLNLSFYQRKYAEQTCFEMSFERDAIGEWCLGLGLLKERLVDSLLIEPTKGNLKLDLKVAPEATDGNITGKVQYDSIHLSLSLVTLDYLLNFSLKYYRDGYADVSHIDLQTSFNEFGDEVYITFQFPDYAGPLSADEAARMLNDE